MRDTPVPGGVPELAKALLWTELAIVLLVSLGRSAVYSVVNLVSALTAPGPLSSQAANLNNSLAPDRPWLDLAYQLLRIGFALVPVALAAYLLVRSGTRLREVWARDGGWFGVRDLGRGALLALGVGSVGVVFYLATYALGTNLTVVAQSLPGEWWRVPVLVLAAAENAVLEEFVVLGFVQVRLRQIGLGDPAAIGLRRCCAAATTSTRASAASSATSRWACSSAGSTGAGVGSCRWWRHTRCSTSAPSSGTPCWPAAWPGCRPSDSLRPAARWSAASPARPATAGRPAG